MMKSIAGWLFTAAAFSLISSNIKFAKPFDVLIFLTGLFIIFQKPAWLELKKIWSAQRHTIVQIRDLQKHSSDATDLKNAASKAGLDSDIVAGLLEAEEAHIADHEEKAVASSELKNKILELIGSLDAGNGADYSEILKKSEMSEEQVDTAIQDLLESGICFEPKAGRIKKL